MANAISVNTKTVEEILTRLNQLARDVQAIKTRVFEQEPPYGSDAWWEKEHEEALKEIKAGRVRKLISVNDLDKPIEELFP